MWRIVLILVAGCLGAYGQTGITSFTVTPSALSFTAADPDTGGPAAQSSTAVIRFNGAFFRPWTLYVQSEGPTLTNCGSIPASALVLRCTSESGKGFLGSTSCNASPIPLSTTSATHAAGNQGIFNSAITANLQVTFAGTWRYRAALAPACTASIRNTADLP
ncbi:MAG: hypothetical protein C0504_02320 [Candidatus Solibacter sp.]|nr:hypothetical protein [Candidatus Solibacter sp.]